MYYRETKNGLYSTLPFVISNTLVNIPFLFACTVLFTLICYWAIVCCFPANLFMYATSHERIFYVQGLHTGGMAFFRFLAFLFLAILAAESQVLIVASLLPVFVAALAISALWVLIEIHSNPALIYGAAWMGSGWALGDTCSSTYISSINVRSADLNHFHFLSTSIKARSLPRFWYYSFHFMDYQKYAFELLTNVRQTNLHDISYTDHFLWFSPISGG